MSSPLIDLVARQTGGMTKPQLLQELRVLRPGIHPAQVEREVQTAIERGRLEFSGDRLTVVAGTSSIEPRSARQDALRVVAFDIESVVRSTTEPPDYREARMFQLGAVRFGRDKVWCHECRTFDAFIDLPGDGWDIRSPVARERWEEGRRPIGEVLEDFRGFVGEADILVAYNGTGVDFPVLDEALRRAELPSLERIRYVDGYYLALALWPTPPRRHRLKDLADRVGAKSMRLQWHDALDDSILLSRLLAVGARQLSRRSAGLQELLRSATVDSDAWDLLFDLAALDPTPAAWNDTEVAALLDAELDDKAPRRTAATPSPTPVPLVIPGSLFGPTGAVSPFELACAAGRRGEPRPAQMAMADAMQSWVESGTPGLLEAPTGTGKSYAMLATALDWLAGGPERKVILATFTKQLQAQLAEDIQALAGQLPGLAALADMVKGKANRLSLRALVTALADCTTTSDRRRPQRVPFTRDVAYRELIVFLALRLAAPASLAEDWEGRSVDAPDIPAFFDEYCARRLHLYLASLSQGTSGEYGGGAGPLSEHTDSVSEAIGNHRLIVANHALLLANLEDLAPASDETLLLIDEAHMLEDAATSAITAVVEYGAIEQLSQDVERWLRSAPGDPLLAEIARVNGDFEQFLDTERLPNAAMLFFDDTSGEVGTRRAALASPRGGALGQRHAVALVGILRELHGHLGALRRQLGAYSTSPSFAGLNRFDTERFWGVFSKVTGSEDAVSILIADAEAILGPPPGRPRPGVTAPVQAGPAGQTAESAQPEAAGEAPLGDLGELGDTGLADPASLHLVEEADGRDAEEDPAELGGPPRPVPLPASNRVVWAEEVGRSDLSGGNRRYRFRLASSPIALPSEPIWRRFLDLVPRTYFISATLTVAGRWGYICSRLGLDPITTPQLALDSPFDAASQARLVCFEDFPSWSEQHDQAVRSVAWQLAGYAREAVTRPGDTWDAPWSKGAMVLTTSKAATSEISMELERLLAEASHGAPVHTATLLGNGRAVDNFKQVGGVVVGTRGLWQGVDVNDPERLSVVWINKLPFAPFADPVIAARRALAAELAEAAGAEDPDQAASEDYYLPLAAIALRQAVGRLIRTSEHRGIVVISDRKLAGATRLRQSYRRVFLGSLDPGLLVDDPETGEPGGGNVVTMAEGWQRMWSFLGESGIIPADRAVALGTPEALAEQTLLPETRAILALAMSPEEERELRARGEEAFRAEVVARCSQIGGLLNGRSDLLPLRDRQVQAIEGVADGLDVLAVLPTGYGKSFAFQLPALVLPGVTVVVSPLVSLMQNQAMDLNRSIGGAVRALVAPLAESNSRLGKAEIADALSGRDSHGIRIVYLSPERLCTRQFQDLLRKGVAAGIVRRVAVDEAHTAVQWGDAFRPSFRRAERFLTTLRTDFPTLAITALTATANQSVREGLRTGLLGLPAEPEGEEPGVRYVFANPMRPELALYRRTLGRGEGGPVTIAGLVEAVVASVHDHAILYCLTVREVDAMWAQLRDALGPEEANRVRRYHGRLPEAEKAAVVSDFIDAPRREDEDFVPMIIIATSAFGLGIDRPDIRCVFVVSPPTDLAALYQQLGRAGRDCSGLERVDPAGPSNVGLALGSRQGFNLVRWMTSQELPEALFLRIAASILEVGTYPDRDEFVTIDPQDLAQSHIAADFDAGRLSEAESRSARTTEEYQVAVVRGIATLAAIGAVEDLGDFPERVKVLPGEILPTDPQMAAINDVLLALGAHRLRRAELTELHTLLIERVSGYADIAPEVGATWALLVDQHALGYLDISQAPSQGMRTGLCLHPAPDGRSRCVPPGFAEQISGRVRRARIELEALRRWYESTDCANVGIAEYFHAEELPPDTCQHGVCRCSSCWGLPEVAAAGESIPPVLRAFRERRPRPVSSTAAGRPAFERNLDGHVESLLWDNRQGLTAGLIHLVLRGGDSIYDSKRHRRRPLWPNLLYSRHRGSAPGVAMSEVEGSLARLETSGVAAPAAERWRLQSHIDADAQREARQVAAAAAVGAP